MFSPCSNPHTDSCRKIAADTARDDRPTDRGRSFEPSAVQGAILLVLILAVAWGVAGQRLLHRPFWMDELHSWLLITDPSIDHAMSALADGADYNPPTYYLAARALTVLGPITEFRLRLLSLSITIGTMLAVYLMLVRRFSVSVSLAATLAAASHPLLILQSTEARFYALWLCLLMWYCWLLTARPQSTPARWTRGTVLAFLAAAICTTHYFGIISVGLVTTAWVGFLRHDRRAFVQGIALMCVAVTAVVCCLPLLTGQKAALTCATWIKPPTISSSLEYVSQFLPMLPLGICFGCAAAGWFMRQQPKGTHEVSDSNPVPDGGRWTVENSVLVSLLLLPVALIGFSWLVQPALVNRYATVAIAGMVPVYAWLLAKSTPVLQRSAVAVASLLLVLAIRHGADTWDHSLQQQRTLQQSLAALPEDQVIVFEDRIDFWLLQHQADSTRQWYQVDFEPSELRRPSNLRTVQRDVGRRIAKWYPESFPMKPMHKLADISQFVVVPYHNKPFGELQYPEQFRQQRLKNN